MGLIADAGMALRGINQHLADLQANDAQFTDKILHAGEGIRDAMRGRLGTDWPQVMDCIRAKLPAESVFVRDQTISAYNWGNQQFPILQPRTSINPTSGAIGPGFPMSVGAAIASGRRGGENSGDPWRWGLYVPHTELPPALRIGALVVRVQRFRLWRAALRGKIGWSH